MVISFKRNPASETCTVEMDIQDFINLTNLISESANEASFDEKSNPSHSERHSRSSEFDSPMTTKQLSSSNAEGKMTPPMATLDANNYVTSLAPSSRREQSSSPPHFRQSLSSSFWKLVTSEGGSNNETNPSDSYPAEGSSRGSDDFDLAKLGISAVVAIVIPHAFGVIRMVCLRSFYAHPIHSWVHNRSGFWIQDAWNPNTFFTQQSETEAWILQRMFPSVCLLSLGSWIVYTSSSSSSSLSSLSSTNIPINFALSIYASFVCTHWADCVTTDLRLSTFWRGLASLELFFVTFAFNSWRFVAGCCSLPAFSLYSYLFFTTYKTWQRWRRHQQAINGFDDEVNTNGFFNANNCSSRGLDGAGTESHRRPMSRDKDKRSGESLGGGGGRGVRVGVAVGGSCGVQGKGGKGDKSGGGTNWWNTIWGRRVSRRSRMTAMPVWWNYGVDDEDDFDDDDMQSGMRSMGRETEWEEFD